MKKKIAVFIIVFLVLFRQITVNSPGVTVQAERTNKKVSKLETQRMDNSDSFVYPVLDDKTISEITHAERVQQYQIPVQILKSLSTESLFDAVLSYPLINEICLYETPEMGIVEIKKQFNGMAELLSRDNLIEVTKEKYEKAVIPKKTIADYSEIDTESYDASMMDFLAQDGNREAVSKDTRILMENMLEETILAQDKTCKVLDSIEETELIEEVVEKTQQKGESELYSYNANSTFLNIVIGDKKNNQWKKKISEKYDVQEKKQVISLKSKLMKRRLTAKKASDYTEEVLTTLKGTKVICKFFKNNPLNSNITNAQIASDYPGCELVHQGYLHNNCHAYAWPRRTDLYLDYQEAQKYVDDGSYKAIRGPRPKKYQIAVWAGFIHSGIVSDPDKENPIITSKFGSYAVVKGPVNVLPYNGTVTYYKNTVC